MTLFISYARKDRELVDALARDIVRAKQQVWLDDDLTGGQDWWDTILAQIRDSRLFIFVLSPDSIRSKACLAELRYASDLARPIVPVMVRDVAVQLAPLAIARAHIVDYRERNADAAVDLVNAIVSAPSPGPLPGSLPEPPTLPASYASSLREQIAADSLTFQQQGLVLMELKAHLRDAEERGVVLALLRDLRHRSDITEVVAKELDSVLADQSDAPDETRGDPEDSADADPGAAHAPDPRLEPTGEGRQAENMAARNAEHVVPAHAEHTGSGDIRFGIRQSGRTRSVLTLVVLVVVAAVAAAAIITMARRGDEAEGLDVESAQGNFNTIIDDTEFDAAGHASFEQCPLGDLGDLARTVDDAVPLSNETLEGDTFFEAQNPANETPLIHCGIEASDHENTDGIWAFTAYSIGDAAQEYADIRSEDDAEEWGDYLDGRIVQVPESSNMLCRSFWLSNEADFGFGVELYGDGCTPENSSLALEAVLPDLVDSLT